MRIITAGLVISLFLFPSYNFAQGQSWQVSKSTHFIVYYNNAPSDFIEELSERAEGYYDNITESLGFSRFEFWLWDNRAKIYIHDNPGQYQSATGQPAWSAGAAIIQEKAIHSFLGAENFFDEVLAHEMGHIIFREFVGFHNNAVPLWLDEGVASYQGGMDSYTQKEIIAEAIANKKFMKLEQLSGINLSLVRDQGIVSLFYAEALSIIDYLIEEFGRDAFVLFCQELRDKQNLNSALAYSYSMSNVEELGENWYKYLNK